MEQVLSYAIKTGAGIFTILFIALLAWVLRANDQRENRYLNVIDKLGDKIDEKVTGLEKDMAEVKADVRTIMSKGMG